MDNASRCAGPFAPQLLSRLAWGIVGSDALKQVLAGIASTNAVAAICYPDGGNLTYMLHCISAVREGVARRPGAAAGFLLAATGLDRRAGYPCDRNSDLERSPFRAPLAHQTAPGPNRPARRTGLNLLRVAGSALGHTVSLLPAFNGGRSVGANNSGPEARENALDTILTVRTRGGLCRGAEP